MAGNELITPTACGLLDRAKLWRPHPEIKARLTAEMVVAMVWVVWAVFDPSKQALSQTSLDAPSQGSVPPSPVAQNAMPAQSGNASEGLAEIVVTAQRRPESLQDVPVAVTALSASMLASVGIQGTQDLSQVTPGLTSPQVAGFEQPHIRGVGSSSNGPGVEAPVATYIDGVYLASLPAALLTLDNIDRIEVLKGPQGTLFGRNATGGLIQIITKDPQQTPSGSWDVSYGNYEDVATDLYATGGLTSDIAADIALRYEHQGEGYGTNLYNGDDTMMLSHDFAGRIKLLFAPTEVTQIRFTLDYEDRLSSRDVQHLSTQYPGTFNNAFFGGPFPMGSPYDINNNIDPRNRLQAGGTSLQINQDFGVLALQSITAYRQSNFAVPLDLDLTPLNLVNIFGLEEDKQFSQEFQLSGKVADALKWVGGLFFFKSNSEWDPIQLNYGPSPVSPVPDTPVDINLYDRQNTTAEAIYGQVACELIDETQLTAGVRYSFEQKSILGNEAVVVDGATISDTPVPTPGLGIPTSVSYSKPTYRLALDHKITADSLVYVSYNTGFKSGGYNLGVAFNPPYAPETITSYEAGIKSEMLDHHLRVNIAGFDYLYKDIQVGRYEDSQETIYNGARARIYGFDIDSQILVGYGFSFTWGLSYIHDRFTSFADADYIVPVGDCVPAAGGVCSGSAASKMLPFTPTLSGNLGATYKTQLSFGTIELTGDYYRTAKYYAAPDNVLQQGGYDIANASITWTDVSNHLSVRLLGKNLGNTLYTTSMAEGDQGGVVAYGAPRTYSVTVKYQW